MPHDDPLLAGFYPRIQQTLASFFHEIDVNLGREIDRYYREDGVFVVAGRSHEGRETISRFYAERNTRILVEQRDGVRTARHIFTNLRVASLEADRARVEFSLMYFSGEGKPPLFGMTTPTVMADCQMDFGLDADGAWRIATFTSQPQFVGDDPFMRKAVVKESDTP